MNNQKGFANIILVLIIVILAGVVGYLTIVKKSEPGTQRLQLPPVPTKQPSPTLQSETALKQRIQSIIEAGLTKTSYKNAGWKTYRDARLKFEIKYPSTWFMTEKATEIKKIEGLIREGLALQVSLANFEYDSEKHLYSFPKPDAVLVSVSADNVFYNSYKYIREDFEKSEKPFLLDGHKATLRIYGGEGEGEEEPNISVTTVKDGISYTISILYYKDRDTGFSINELLNTPHLSAFGEMLSTFNFTK